MKSHFRLLAMASVASLVWFGPALAQTAAPEPRPAVRPTSTPRPAPAQKANEYTTEAEAKQRCGTDAVVWVNPRSKVFHTTESKDYGKTKRGGYMCKAEAEGAKYRAVRASKGKAKS